MRGQQTTESSPSGVGEVIQRLKELPTLPAVALKVMDMLEDNETSLSQLARMIRGDQSMTTKILKVANSAYYGFPKRVPTVSLAVVILGTENVKNLVLSISIMDLVSQRIYRGNIDRRKLWAHPLLCAAACKVLSRRYRFERPEESFVAGLIHDIGKVVIDCHFHEAFVEIQSMGSASASQLLELERSLVGMDHAEIGQRLCQKWNFPTQLAEAVGQHHNPSVLGENNSLPGLVFLGNAVAKQAMAPAEDGVDLLAKLLALAEEEVQVLLQETCAEFEKANVFLEL